MRWNGITDMRQCTLGMKLIVRKGDPNKLTDAEKMFEEKERKFADGAVLTAKRLKGTTLMDNSLMKKYDRVYKLATDIDFHSLGNRMFGKEKRQLELFPDNLDPNSNPNSLAVRLRRSKNTLVDSANGKPTSKVLPRYFISEDNEDEWRHVADELAMTMLNMLVEYEAYSVVLEQKRMLRSTVSLIGRINQYEKRKKKEEEDNRDKISDISEGHNDKSSEMKGSDQIISIEHEFGDINMSEAKMNIIEHKEEVLKLPKIV